MAHVAAFVSSRLSTEPYNVFKFVHLTKGDLQVLQKCMQHLPQHRETISLYKTYEHDVTFENGAERTCSQSQISANHNIVKHSPS